MGVQSNKFLLDFVNSYILLILTKYFQRGSAEWNMFKVELGAGLHTVYSFGMYWTGNNKECVIEVKNV